MYSRRPVAVKVFAAVSLLCIVIFSLFFILPKEKPEFTCVENSNDSRAYTEKKSENFSCYADYYQKITETSGVKDAAIDLKARAESDTYAKRECHLLMHVIGRKAALLSASLAEAFVSGDSYCGGGYFHGVTESIVQQQGKDISPAFLDGLCTPFRSVDGADFSINHLDCAHGLGHALMYVNNNELFDSLRACDSLSDYQEQYPCWMGVFMENGIADTEDHSTKYLKTDDLMYPCTAVGEQYKPACYAFQTSYILRVTGSFDKMLTACRESPKLYQNICFESVGRDVAGEADLNIERSKNGCLALSERKEERESCVRATVKVLIHNYRSGSAGDQFCSSLPEGLKETCFETAEMYKEVIKVAP